MQGLWRTGAQVRREPRKGAPQPFCRHKAHGVACVRLPACGRALVALPGSTSQRPEQQGDPGSGIRGLQPLRDARADLDPAEFPE